VTVLLLKRSILTEKIARRGLHITREYSTDPFQLMLVREVMVEAVDTLPVSMPVDEAVAFFTGEEARHRSYPVVDEANRVVGMAHRAEILRWMAEGPHGVETLGETLSAEALLCGHPEETVAYLVERMIERDLGRVPIVDDGGHLVGLVARKDLLHVHARQRTQETHREALLISRPRSGRRRPVSTP
jgi:CBS domain-containing protein